MNRCVSICGVLAEECYTAPRIAIACWRASGSVTRRPFTAVMMLRPVGFRSVGGLRE